MASPRDLPPPPGEHSLVLVTRIVYAAPGGSYANMEFLHVSGCPLAAPHHDAVVRDLVACMGFYDFSLVEAAANTVLLTRECSPDCRFDRGSTLGLFARQRLEDSSFSPSPHSLNPSQLTSSGSALPPLASDSFMGSSSWSSLEAPSAPSPTPSPVRLVPSVGAPPPSLTNYGLAPSSSFLCALSPGKQQLYGSKFPLEATSDSDYHPSGDGSSPSPPPARPRIEAAPTTTSRAAASGFAGSGFALSSPSSIEQRPRPQLLRAPVPVSRHHVRFADAIEAPPPPWNDIAPIGVAASHSPPLLVARSPDVADVAMMLCDGRNTNASGLGNSKHALPGIPEFSLSSLFAPLPPTAFSVTVDMLDILDEIEQGRSAPVSDSSSSSVEDIPSRRFHYEGAALSDDFGSVANNVQALGEGHNELLDAVSKMANHVSSLERLCRRLQKCMDKLEDADDVLAYGKSEFAPSYSADDSPVRNCRQQQRWNRTREGPSVDVPAPPAAAGPSGPAPAHPAQTATITSAAPVAASDPPPIPSATRPVTSGPAACVPRFWVEVVK